MNVNLFKVNKVEAMQMKLSDGYATELSIKSLTKETIRITLYSDEPLELGSMHIHKLDLDE